MADEILRLKTELVDNASGPLRKLMTEMAAIKRSPGMEAATKWMDEFNEKSHGFVRECGGAAGVINAMGIGGLTAAASLSELVGHFKELAERQNAMRELGREVGLTVNQLNALNHAAQAFDLAPDKMQAAINNFAGQMPQFMRGFGQLHDELAKRFPKLVSELQGEGMQDQIKSIFKFLGQDALQKDPQRQKQMMELFFGGNSDDMERLFAKGGDGFMKQVDQYARTLEPITKEYLGQSELLRKGLLEFNDSIEKLETKAGPKIISGLNEVLGEFTTLFANLDRLEHWWSSTNFKQKSDGVAGALDDQMTMTPGQLNDKFHGTGNFAPAKDAAEAQRRIAEMQERLGALQSGVRNDKNPIGFGVRHANDYGEIRELSEAIKQLKDELTSLTSGATAEKSSYRGAGPFSGLLQHASFSTGFGSGGDGTVAGGVKAGVLAAFHEWATQGDVETGVGGPQDGRGGASGFPGLGSGGMGGRGRRRGACGRGGAGRRRDDGAGGDVDLGGSAAGNLTRLIDEVSKKAGIDPRIMEGIRAGESGHGSRYDKKDDAIESSWGPFQLNRRRGLGVQFEKETGLDVRDPSTIAAQARWVANYIKKGGSLGAWMGYHGPRNADPRWGDSGYEPSDDMAKKAGIPAGGFKVPKGGYWAKDSKGNPVPVGPDGQSLGPDGRPARIGPIMPLPAPKAAPIDISGASKIDIHLHDKGSMVRRTAVQSTGDVMTKLHRWPGMPNAADWI